MKTYRHTVSHLALKHIQHIRQRWGEAIYRACKVKIRKKLSCLSLLWRNETKYRYLNVLYFMFLCRFVAIWADSAIFNKPSNSEFGIPVP